MKFSKKIAELIEQMRAERIADIEALKEAQKISDAVMNKEDDSVPDVFSGKPGADIMYRNIHKAFEDIDISDEQLDEIVERVYDVIIENAVVDWWKNVEHKRRMRGVIDDYLYDEVRVNMQVDLSQEKMDEIVDLIIELAQNNHDIFRL